MRNIMKGVFFKILTIIPFKRNYIIFESFPELDGSPWMIYSEMKRIGFEKKYKLIWFVDKSYKSPDGVLSLPIFGERNLVKKICYYWILAKAKMIVDSNRFVNKVNSKTFRLHTQHGAPLKKCFVYTWNMGEVDAILSLSENTIDVENEIFPSARGKIFPLGYPTNDRLFVDIDLRKKGFWNDCLKTNNIYRKIIGWLPTYRQHKNVKSPIKSDMVFPFGVPLLYTKEMFRKLNECLKENNVLLAVQIHPAQAKNFPVQNCSNIVVISPALKQKYNVSTANMMHDFDALITDYSAAYHEYLLLDRPIALSIDDYEEYAKNPGFSLDYFDWIKGVYLKTTDDLIKFIEDVANDVDSAKEEREKAMRRIHKYIDDKSTQRVVDFLIEKAEL